MVHAIRKRQLWMLPLLLVTVLLVATPPTLPSGNAAYPCTGTLSGTLGPGTGTVSVFGMNQQITTNTAINGTFNGDTTGGSVSAVLNSNYSVPSLAQNGHTSGTVTGTYTMSIDPSGAITGTVTIPLTGDFGGQVKVTLQGTESPTGSLTGTWSGTMTLTKVTGPLGTFSSNIVGSGSGQFTGSEQRSVAQTTTTATSAPTTEIAPTSAAAVTSAEMTSTAENMTQPNNQGGSSLPYVLAAVVAIIVIVGALAVKLRRPKKP